MSTAVSYVCRLRDVFRFHRRKDGCYWLTVFGLEFSGQLVWLRHAPAAKLQWGSGDGARLGFMVSCLATFWFHWDIPWKVSRRVPFLRGEQRELGVDWFDGSVRAFFGYQPMGTHWGRRTGRLGGLRAAWMNKKVALWRNTWVIGRDRVTWVTLDEREVVIDAGRWPGDSYPATQKLERMTWRNRFRTIERTSLSWEVKQGHRGIPTDTKGKWGDRYSETYGFGAEDDGTGAPNILAARLKLLLRNWPEGLIVREMPG